MWTQLRDRVATWCIDLPLTLTPIRTQGWGLLIETPLASGRLALPAPEALMPRSETMGCCTRTRTEPAAEPTQHQGGDGV